MQSATRQRECSTAELCCSSENCNFDISLESLLRDQLVWSSRWSLTGRLLRKENLAFTIPQEEALAHNIFSFEGNPSFICENGNWHKSSAVQREFSKQVLTMHKKANSSSLRCCCNCGESHRCNVSCFCDAECHHCKHKGHTECPFINSVETSHPAEETYLYCSILQDVPCVINIGSGSKLILSLRKTYELLWPWNGLPIVLCEALHVTYDKQRVELKGECYVRCSLWEGLWGPPPQLPKDTKWRIVPTTGHQVNKSEQSCKRFHTKFSKGIQQSFRRKVNYV